MSSYEDVESQNRKNEQILEKDMKQSFAQIVKEQEAEREKDFKTNDKEIQQKMAEMLQKEKRRDNLIIRSIKVPMEKEKTVVDTILEALFQRCRLNLSTWEE